MKIEPTPEEYDNYLQTYKQYFEENRRLNQTKRSLEQTFPKTLITFIVLVSLLAYLISDKWWIFLIVGYVVLMGYEPLKDLLIGITSSGRYKQLKQQIEDLNKSTRAKVLSFEDAYKSYFEDKLKNFYEERLFRKRSGTEQFESALSEFATMLEEAKSINSIFLNKRIDLKDYENYLIGRMGMSLFRKKHTESKLSSYTRNLVAIRDTANNPPVVVKVAPPETYYSTPRHVDWELINKAKKIIGEHGEEIVMAIEQNYLRSVNRPDLAEKVRHFSKEEGDGAGYDIQSFSNDGKTKYIEVKSTKNSNEAPFYLSRNEFSFLKSNQGNAFIYRVLNVNEKEDKPLLKVYTASEVLNSEEIVPVQYLVNMRS
ncbi:MAG: DUF3883 domain-containing protein [Patescibacteria group bacterium]